MSELLEQLAADTGVPADLLERAAAARAQASGGTAEQVVAGWAGVAAPAGEAAPAAAPEPAAPAAAEAAPPAAAASEAPPSAPAPAEAAPAVEVLEPTAAPPEIPSDVEGEEVAEESGTASILSGFPGWLAAAFIILPSIALLYALVTPDAPACGSAGQLAIDPITGNAVNCDGTEYGVEIVNFFTIGRDVYAECSACHGADGGGGTGPAFTGGAVLTTFNEGNCADHIEWVALGTDGWPAVRGATYGDNNKPVGGSGAVMPAFGTSLTPEELAAVVLYERVAFGGQTLTAAEEDCGPGEPEVVAGP